MVCRAINEKINGMVIGSINCWESVSESTADQLQQIKNHTSNTRHKIKQEHD